MEISRTRNIFVIFACVLLISACSKYGDFNEEQICRATMAAIKGKSPGIIKVEKTEIEKETELKVFYLYYLRPDDGNKWHFRCKVDRARVIWAQGNGRWRDQAQDPTVRYAIKGDELEINETFPDGSKASDMIFNLSLF